MESFPHPIGNHTMLSDAEENLIRQYLLGEATEHEQEQVAERLFYEDDYAEHLLLLEDELIDEYVREALSPAERSHFEQHFLVTTKRQQKLALAQALVKYAKSQETAPVPAVPAPPRHPGEAELEREPWWRNWFAPKWKLAAYAVLVLGLGLGLWWQAGRTTDLEQGLVALNQAYREQRPVQTRVTGLEHAPFAVRRSGEPERLNVTARNRAERILLDAAEAQKNAAAWHALGRLYLTEKKFEEAIQEFEKALPTDANNARLHSDLGAALLEKGNLEANSNAGRDLRTFDRSLEHLNRALELDATRLEALFNRALLRQSVGLRSAAKADWQRYLQQDPASPWAAEAREHLRVLETEEKKVAQREDDLFGTFWQAWQTRNETAALQAYRQSHLRNGNHIVSKLTDESLSALQRQEATADYLDALTWVGELSARHDGEHAIKDMAQFYRTLPVARVPLLVRARHALQDGYKGFFQPKRHSALPGFATARQLFAQAGNEAEALLAEALTGFYLARQSETHKSLTIFQTVRQRSEAKQYRWLLSLSLIGLANVSSLRSEYSQVIESARQSLQVANQIADDNGKLRALNVLANTYRTLGNQREAWRVALQGIELGRAIAADPSQMASFFGASAWGFSAQAFYAPATDYESEALALSRKMKSPLTTALHAIQLGVIYLEQKDFAQAIAQIKEGQEISRSLLPEKSAQARAVYASFYLARAYRQAGRLQEAEESLHTARQFADENDEFWLRHEAAKERLQLLLAQGKTTFVAEELQRVLALAEEQRQKIHEESNRHSFFAEEQSIYDIAIDFATTGQHDPVQAFNYAELSRARTLLDELSGGTQATSKDGRTEVRLLRASRPANLPLHLEDVRSALPADVQLLQYAALEQSLVIWVVTRQQMEAKVVRLPYEQLKARVSTYLEQLAQPPRAGTTMATGAAQELYEWLIQPVASLLNRAHPVFIIPDKILTRLPFGALFSAQTNQYLLEEFALCYAPSATIFVRASQEARRKAQTLQERLLSVGNPRFTAKLFPQLANLPAAAREATEIVRYYDVPTLMVGPQAKKETVCAEMARADVIHIASHYVSDTHSPTASRLLLAGDENENSAQAVANQTLTPAEIHQLNLRRARLVVLSACQSHAEEYVNGEGALGIARSFAAAGVPLVVASLWAVDSEATAELMTTFHRGRKQEQMSAAQALRAAQRALRQSANPRYQHPYYWAPFVIVGGHSTL